MHEELNHFIRHSEKRRLQVIAGIVSKSVGLRVLDAGCGNGELSEMLVNRGLRVFAADLGFDSIHRASSKINGKKFRIPFSQADIYRLPFRENSFDAVVASEVMEHLERPRDAMLEAARILRPGGYLIVSTPYRERLQYTLCIHCNTKTPVNAHLHSFDDTVLGDMLKETGFSVERVSRISSKPAEWFGMPGLTYFLPYFVWRFMDAFCCRLLGKQSFMVIRAKKE